MKVKTLCIVLPFVLLACSKQPSQNTNQVKVLNARQTELVPRPFKTTVVITPEARDIADITNQAKGLLLAKQYDKLEELARKYRNSKECYPDGSWKLQKFYEGISLDDNATPAQLKERVAIIREWVASKPDSITARVALADQLISYAWNARGSGYAKTVSQEGWQLFGARLQEAVKVLQAARDLPESCPQWWSDMLVAGLGLGASRQQYDPLFNSAIQFEPGFSKFYARKAYYLMPRWYGKPGEVQNFLQKSADNLGGEEGDILYARIAWALKRVSGNVFDDFNLSWERVDRGFQALEKQFPHSINVANARAYFTVFGSTNKRLVRQAVNKMQGKVDVALWTDTENYMELTDDLYSK